MSSLKFYPWMTGALFLFSSLSHASLLGEEMIPLVKLVAGQVLELERLAETVGVSKEQRDLLLQINQGIDQSTHQIDSIQTIVDRTQGLDPSSVRSLSEFNHYLEQTRALQAQTQEIVNLKLLMTDQAISQSAVQSETAYTMGQEMVGVGSQLAIESKTASPGRASQITASAQSAQMLSSGVALQTLAQIAQLQAMQLELQKVQIEKDSKNQSQRQGYFEKELIATRRRRSR